MPMGLSGHILYQSIVHNLNDYFALIKDMVFVDINKEGETYKISLEMKNHRSSQSVHHIQNVTFSILQKTLKDISHLADLVKMFIDISPDLKYILESMEKHNTALVSINGGDYVLFHSIKDTEDSWFRNSMGSAFLYFAEKNFPDCSDTEYAVVLNMVHGYIKQEMLNGTIH